MGLREGSLVSSISALEGNKGMESCSSQNRSTGGIDDKMSLVPLSHEMNEARSHEAALPEEDGKNQGQTENDTPFHTLRPPALKGAGAAISPQGDSG